MMAGFKYNPPNGGPAESAVTDWIEAKANEFLESGLAGVKRIPFEKALRASTTHRHDYLNAYITDLANVLDMDAIRGAKISMGVDPLGGAGVHYWEPIAERYGLNLTVVNEAVDPTFRFMTVDWDGQIRMDPSSPYAMQRLIGLKDRFDIAFACDTDHDRHGIVTQSAGLLPPNHYLSVAIFYLFQHRPKWRKEAAVGKTVVSSQMIDRVTAKLGRKLYEVPVGLQVVRGWLARRFAWLRWRRERGGFLCSSGWQRLDDGQRWNCPGVARGGDHSPDGPRSRRNLPRTHARVRRAGLRPR